MAPAAADVVFSGISLASTLTANPASARTTAVVSPITPAPTTITLCPAAIVIPDLEVARSLRLHGERSLKVRQQVADMRVAGTAAKISRQLAEQHVAAGRTHGPQTPDRDARFGAGAFKVTAGGVRQGQPRALVQGTPLSGVVVVGKAVGARAKQG